MCDRQLLAETYHECTARRINAVPMLRALRRRWWLLLASLAIVMLLARVYWLPAIREMLIVADPLHPADAIVPLAGGLSRTTHAAMLYRQGYAEWFVVTDRLNAAVPVYPISEWGITEEAVANGVPQHRLRSIIVPMAPVGSTYEEALAVRDLAEAQGWTSLIVVTSPAHTRRAHTIFRDVFAGSSIIIRVRPASSMEDAPVAWWHDPRQRTMVWQEYAKLIAYRMGYH